ncbi:hypothetical protein GFS31_31100 [Leptolyngbya sp. BL0902]|nr:hypothetical protein GFS31_31100 [Leptolyngbya sp. BL0902]
MSFRFCSGSDDFMMRKSSINTAIYILAILVANYTAAWFIPLLNLNRR